MAEKDVDRRVVYCLICHKPSETISTHLASVCMKDKSPEERHAEMQRAKASTKRWTQEGRIWDYKDICTWLHHGPSRCALSQELQRRGFFVLNRPEYVAMAKAEETMGPAEGGEPSTSSAEPSAAPSTPRPAEDPIQSESELEASTTSDLSWQWPTSEYSNTMRARMQEENLYAKFPPETSLLKQFKEHLVTVWEFPNCQQEVDNVSRVLRYIQPTGDDINLDFLQKTTMLGDYFNQLKKVGQSAATRLNSIKSMIQFIDFLMLQYGATDLSVFRKCSHYQEFLKVLRIPISKDHNRDLCAKRYDYFVGLKKTVHSLQKVLHEAKKDILGIYRRLLKGEDVAEEEKTHYRYYCEAILILGHFQRPGAVEGLAVTDWLKKQSCKGRFVVTVKSHKTANSQVAAFALTEEEAALINQYYMSIRPDHLKDGNDDNTAGPERLFVSQNGQPIKSATNDLRRLHEIYKCPNITSQEIRQAVETEGELQLTDEQKTDLAHYCVAKSHYHTRDPVSIVNTANILQLITRG
uniref:Uncharacterized protein n=1 Tax=Neogobius melanostomus TaxID=47308 RepID=A0A8C6UJC5_9GOBI